MSDVMTQMEKFVETLNKAMPGAWEAAVKQAYIHGILWLVAGIVFSLICLYSYNEHQTVRAKENKKDVDEGWETFIAFVALFTFIFAIIAIIKGGMFLFNPDYQAIKLLMP